MTRTFVIGDPQAPFAKVLDVLRRHDVLEGDRLVADVVLVSIGDHFDFDHRDPQAGAEGLRVLRWLASHDPAQVKLVFGNHDAARVMEFAWLSDDEHAAARALTPIDYAARHPELPPHGVVARDYASFSVEQRTLVIELLLARRFHLALAGELADGRIALITHAGVLLGQLTLLQLPFERDPRRIAEALNGQLAVAIDDVRPDWQRGVTTPLSLEPFHTMGSHGREGGGLLYHRPSNPDPYDEPAYRDLFSVGRMRRFAPQWLPKSLTQIAGHTGHAKCVQELAPWCTDAARARAHGGIRTLRVVDNAVTYDLGVAPRLDGAADLIMIDGELRRLPADEVDLLPLARVL